MFTIDSLGQRTCDGVNRRSFLTVGAVGLGGLTLTDLLRADDQGVGRSVWAKKSIINVFLGGGPSHIDTFDLKPEAPREFRGEFQPIDTNVPGVQICEHLPELAARMNDLAIVRSLTGLYEEHSPHQTETGWSEQSLRSSGGRPSFGSVVSRLQGANNGSCPTFVDLTGHTKYGFLGPVYGAFRPDGEGRANLSLAGGVTTGRLDDRTKLLGGLDRLKRDADSAGSMKAMDSFAERAVSVITSGAVAKALDLNQEDPRIRERYVGSTANPYRENDRFLLARRLIDAGVRCVSLSWGGWDTHGDNFGHLRRQLPPFDRGLAALVDDLKAHGQLDDTILIVWGEFGRTPRVNGGAGRDHWPRAASVLLGGGGLQTGQVIGSTNRLGEQPTDRPVHLQEIVATLYQHMGVDPRFTTLIDNNGRPQYLVDHNAVVKELIA